MQSTSTPATIIFNITMEFLLKVEEYFIASGAWHKLAGESQFRNYKISLKTTLQVQKVHIYTYFEQEHTKAKNLSYEES